jgi:hypothetical protein
MRNITVRELGDMSSGIESYTTVAAITSRYFARRTTAWGPQRTDRRSAHGALRTKRSSPPGAHPARCS